MKNWANTSEGKTFIQSGDSRETHACIMQAIASFATNSAEAESIWEGDAGDLHAIWREATQDGKANDQEMNWGASTLHEVIKYAEKDTHSK